MPRRNRVDPWGDLHAVAARGLFTGNRGCLVDSDRRLVRHHRGSLWITCVTEFRGRRNELDRPGRWTPLFFLDEAVALAAGHRPCGECRRAAYLAYREAAGGDGAADLNRRLASERLVSTPGRRAGLSRARHRRLWPADPALVPPGAVLVDGTGRALLMGRGVVQAFGFEGWGAPEPWPVGGGGPVEMLTPPTSVAALAAGYRPVLHPTAAAAGS